jgi:hypothetical protein
MTSAVRATASPPSTPMLSVNADRESMKSRLTRSYFPRVTHTLRFPPAERPLSDGIRGEIASSELWEDGTRVAMDYSW